MPGRERKRERERENRGRRENKKNCKIIPNSYAIVSIHAHHADSACELDPDHLSRVATWDFSMCSSRHLSSCREFVEAAGKVVLCFKLCFVGASRMGY